MSKLDELILNIVSAAIVLGIFVLAIGCDPVAPGQRYDPQKYEIQTRKEGQRAARAGISAEANPYQGTSSQFAHYWLEGYLTEVEKSHVKSVAGGATR